MEIHEEGTKNPPQIVQMMLSHNANETGDYNLSDFMYREYHTHPDTDSIRVLRAPIDDEMLIFILRHLNDYDDIDYANNGKEYPRMIAEGKVLIYMTPFLKLNL